MNIGIGITKLIPSWEAVLQQIGVCFHEINYLKNNLNDYPVIIISSKLSKEEKKNYSEYLFNGGGIITEASLAENLFKVNTKSSYLKFIYSENSDIFYNYFICDLYKRSKIARDANHLENQKNNPAVLHVKKGKGNLIVFPDNFVSALYDKRIIRKNFYSNYSEKYTSERVSKVSKGIIKIHIQKALEYLFHIKDLPFVHLWNFPNGEKNIFAFRIDTDFGTREEIKSLYKLLEEYKIPAAWFIETRSSQNWIRLFNEFENQEIAYHCYRHKNFTSYKKDKDDFETGLKILRDAGINPNGYAAPYGEWNEIVGRLSNEFNFLYSSEFGFAYDALPFYPLLNNSLSNVLQIPIHPISVGRLHWGGHTEENMIKYYFEVIDNKLFVNEPIFLYTHPFEKRLNVFKEVFKKIKEINIPLLTLSEYAEWWRKRITLTWNAKMQNDKIIINSNADQSMRCRVIYPSKKNVFLSFNSDKEDIFENNKNFSKYTFYPVELRKKTLRMIRHDVLGKLRKMKQ